MDPIRALDMEFRSGIAPSEVDDFADRMDMISKAMEEIKNGTFDPNTCKIPGYKTPEQEEAERLEAIRHEEDAKRRADERKRQLKSEERETWWMKARLRFSVDTEDGDAEHRDNQSGKQEKAQFAANRALAAYKERDANDYSIWTTWEPQDPVTLQEITEKNAELEKQRNRDFEANNPDFCGQFKDDLEKRQRTQFEKEKLAEKCKQQGNQFYKRRQYALATQHYMQALDKSPFSVAVLTNIAQSHLRLGNLDDSVEFSSRALFVNPEHVKALSRRAAAWHLQKKWKEAAQDMDKALQLEPGNQDVVEQHSIIVGDYEDSIAQSELDAKLANASTITKFKSDDEREQVQELRFVVELLSRMDDVGSAAPGNQDDHDQTEMKARDAGDLLVHASWIAYELLLPFLEKNESVRTFFRTSGELHKLCSRLVSVIDAQSAFNMRQQKQQTAKGVTARNSKHQELIVNAMINCATAAMGSCPRNQIVLFQNAPFRKAMLAAFTKAADDRIRVSHVLFVLPLSTRASVLRFFDEAIECKSWKRVMTIPLVTTASVLHALLKIVELFGGKKSDDSSSHAPLAKFERLSKQSLILSASSICFTLSSDDHSIRELIKEPEYCIRAIAASLTNWETMDARALSNLLGFLTNLSTFKMIQATVDTIDGYNEDQARPQLVRDLLDIASEFTVQSRRKSVAEDAISASERALAALLNLSFFASAGIRRDLAAGDVVATFTSIFSAAIDSEAKNFSKLLLVLSRAISLVCRLHPVLSTEKVAADTSEGVGQTVKQIADRDMLELLYRVCLQALSSTRANAATTTDNNTSKTVIPGETWQLCAQIWCHIGWCIHEPSVREYLREKRALHAMFQAIVLSNSQPENYRSVSSSHEAGTSARERLVGNIAKVLITMYTTGSQHDAKLFGSNKNLKALVDALQALPDGLARTNVAILLAKLCQSDQQVKKQVRELRGIEMMLAVSQSLKPGTAKGKLQ